MIIKEGNVYYLSENVTGCFNNECRFTFLSQFDCLSFFFIVSIAYEIVEFNGYILIVFESTNEELNTEPYFFNKLKICVISFLLSKEIEIQEIFLLGSNLSISEYSIFLVSNSLLSLIYEIEYILSKFISNQIFD